MNPTRHNLVDAPATVLLVEDDRMLRDVLTDVLEEEGFGVVAAADGAAVEHLAQLHAPDVILLDLGLPGRPGSEVLEQLKRDPATRTIPVILTSGAAVDRGRADAALAKPYDLDVLLEHVWRTINTRLAARPAQAAQPGWG